MFNVEMAYIKIWDKALISLSWADTAPGRPLRHNFILSYLKMKRSDCIIANVCKKYNKNFSDLIFFTLVLTQIKVAR